MTDVLWWYARQMCGVKGDVLFSGEGGIYE